MKHNRVNHSKLPSVSVVIPTYNRPGLAKKLKKSIQDKYQNIEVVIVDQTNQTHVNTSLAKNEGYLKTSGEIVIFFDDDVEVLKDTIRSHINEYKDDTVVGVAGRVINDGEHVPENKQVKTGKANNILTKFDKNFWGEVHQEVDFVYGCNMSFRRVALDLIGGFDINWLTPLSAFEEIDLSFRIKKMGKIIFCPQALVYHHKARVGGTRVSKDQREKMYYHSYGRLVKKHVKPKLWIQSLLIIAFRIIRHSPFSLFSFLSGFLSTKIN